MKYIVWDYVEFDGWEGQEFDTLAEALAEAALHKPDDIIVTERIETPLATARA